jgi:hypothetical protein
VIVECNSTRVPSFTHPIVWSRDKSFLVRDSKTKMPHLWLEWYESVRTSIKTQ